MVVSSPSWGHLRNGVPNGHFWRAQVLRPSLSIPRLDLPSASHKILIKALSLGPPQNGIDTGSSFKDFVFARVFVCLHECRCACTYVCVRIQRPEVDTKHLPQSLSILSKQGLSQNLEFASSASGADRLAQRTPYRRALPPWLVIYVGAQDANSGCHTCAARASSTESSLQP